MDQNATTNSSRGQAAHLSAAPTLADQVEVAEVAATNGGCMRASDSWNSWIENQSVSNDFLSVREQPCDQERESIDARASLGRGGSRPVYRHDFLRSTVQSYADWLRGFLFDKRRAP